MEFYFVEDEWLDGGIRMITVARVTIQCNPEREAGAAVFDGVFIGELYCSHFFCACE